MVIDILIFGILACVQVDQFWNKVLSEPDVYILPNDKEFLKEFLGRRRNLEEKIPFWSDISPIYGGFEGSGGAFSDLGPGKNKDFLLEYTPMLELRPGWGPGQGEATAILSFLLVKFIILYQSEGR